MSNVDALKKLYVSLGGSADSVKNVTLIDEMIDKISTVASSGIPSHSASDKNKILSVGNDGSLSLTSNINYIDVTIAESSVTLPEGTTYESVYNLLKAGVDVRLRGSYDGGDPLIFTPYLCGDASKDSGFISYVWNPDSGVEFLRIHLNSVQNRISTGLVSFSET